MSRPRNSRYRVVFFTQMLRFTQEILLALRTRANEEEAHAMSKSMRDSFDFLGVNVIKRREATYPIFDKNPPKNGDELATRVSDMWIQPYREVQYAACDYLFKHKALLGGQHLNFLKMLIKTRPWKDTVGKIIAINEKKRTVSMMVEMFGRETKVELDFAEVKKVT